MLISELAAAAGVSPRALRHYEDRGLLARPATPTGTGCTPSDITRVAQIKTMISAGLGTATIQQYLDCARTDDHGTTVEICPDLRAELDSLANHLKTEQAELRATQRRLTALAGH